MKILYLITKSEAGGAQTHVADLCRYFKERKHEIAVMSSGHGWLEEECQKLDVAFIENRYFSNKPSPRKLFKAIKEIRRFTADFKPDIVHCHSSAAGILGRLAIRGKIKTIYTAHGWGFNVGMKPWIKYPVLLLEKFCSPYTYSYICVAEFVKNLGLKYHLASPEKFQVIYNGIEINEDQIRKEKNEKIKLSFLGRLAEPKRPELAMKAIGDLPQNIKNKIEFTIIGDGTKKIFLENLAKKLNIECHFLGSLPRSQAIAELKKTNIFVFISAWEGFPYTILEAMSCGLPIIASRVGGVSEAVNEYNGILVNNDLAEIKKAILELAGNENLIMELGEKGKKTVMEKFSLKKMLQEIEKTYKD